MAFNYDWTIDPTFSTTSTYKNNQPANSLFDFGDWDQFNFEPLVPHTAEDDHTLSLFSPLQPPADFYSLLLSPPSISEPSSTPTLAYSPTPGLLLAGPSSIQPPAATQPNHTLPTPPAQAQEPAPNEVTQFDFCPWTRHGQVCGYVSWARSANKQIKRHIKAVHFPDTSLGYECPNTKCTHTNHRFLRKDACKEHRRGCDSVQAPGYVPLPDIVSGNDAEVDRWMRARQNQRKAIIKRLKNGTPWSDDLLEPVSL